MQGETHQGKGLKYITVLPDDYNPEISYPLLIMLHGFGANMQDLAGLAPVINSRGQGKGLKYITVLPDDYNLSTANHAPWIWGQHARLSRAGSGNQ